MATHLRIKGLRREDYKDAPAWFDALLITLNQALGDTANALNGGLTFAENMRAELKTIEVTMPSEFPTWHLVGATGEPAFQNGFTNWDASGFRPASFRMWPNGMVEISGFVKQSPTAATFVAIFQLPSGYRPPRNYRFSELSSIPTGIGDRKSVV